MTRLVHTYRIVNLLSIDIALGAVLCCLFFGKLLNVEIKTIGLVALGLTVWIIYTGDHLLDARRVKTTASTERHRFHQNYFKEMFYLLLLAMAIDVVAIIYIRKPVFESGLLFSCVVLLYFVVQRHLKFIKEFFAALLYTGGVLLAPLSLNVEQLRTDQIIIMIQFGITALINLLLYSWFDYEQDVKDHNFSFATIYGLSLTKLTLTIILILNFMFSTYLFFNAQLITETILMVTINFILLIIFLQEKYFSINDRYRLLGDAVFLLPAFYLLM